MSQLDVVRCRVCGVDVAAATSESCSGTCMPCYKAAHGGLVPKAFARVEALGLEGLHARWTTFCRTARPAGGGPWDEGPAVEASLAGWISSFFAKGSLPDDARARMWMEVRRLKGRDVPLSWEAERYFEELETIADEVLDALGAENVPRVDDE